MNEELLNVVRMPSVLHNLVLGLPKPWEIFAGGPFLFTLMQVLGKVQSSSRKEPHKNQVHLYRSMRLSARRHGKLAGGYRNVSGRCMPTERGYGI